MSSAIFLHQHVKFEGDMGDIADYDKDNEISQAENLFCNLTCSAIDTCVTQAQKTCDKESDNQTNMHS